MQSNIPDVQITVTHIENADTNAAVVAAASATQRVYVLALFYRNGTGGTLTPALISNAKAMWRGTAQATTVSNFYWLNGLPCSDSVNQSVTFLATASATSDLTVWWYYGP